MRMPVGPIGSTWVQMRGIDRADYKSLMIAALAYFQFPPSQRMAVVALVIGVAVFPLAALAQISPPGNPCTNCPPANPSTPAPPAPERSLIEFEIRHVGTVRVALFDQQKPASAKNFLNYVLSGAYSNNIVHRSVSNSLFQGGSLRIIEFSPISKAVVPVEESTAVTNELGLNSFFSNARGTLALAHYPGETNSATCHWFINLTNNAFLDVTGTNYSFSVIGRVVSGLENLDKLNPAHPSSVVKILNLGGWMDEAPVKPTATPATVTYDDLLTINYRVISLDVDLQLARGVNGTNRISWNSVSNKLHTLQYSNVVPPSWQALGTVTGTGVRLTYTNVTTISNRFYRVTYQP